MNTLSALESWLVVLALALGTFLIRFSFIGIFAGRTMPMWLSRSLKLLVPAIFAAIVANGVAMESGQFAGFPGWPRFAAATIALWVALRFNGNVLATVSFGMLSLHGFLMLQRAM